MNRKILAVVTGMQHSGTTYLNNIINSHSRIMSGFECGILLNKLENFDKVQPFSEWLKIGKTLFGLPNNYLEEIKNMNYEEVYNYIAKNKGSKNDCHYQELIKKCPNFTDKTPAYIYQLENIYNKVKKLKIPFIVILKNYDEIYYSWVIKRKITYKHFIENIKLVIQSLEFISKNPKENIYVMEYQDVINKKEKYNNHLMNIITTYNKVIPREKLFEEKFNQKIKHTNVYQSDKKATTINVNTENHKFKETYNQLLNSLKIKL